MKKYLVLVFSLTMLLILSTGLMAQNNCLEFDGTDDYVEANSLTTPLSSAGSFTIECWFKGDDISSDTGNQILWGINGPTSNTNTNIIMFAVHGDVLKVYDGNATGYTATTTIQQNNWYHVAFVKSSNDDSFIVYLNGIQELTGSQEAAIPDGNTFSIGQEWDENPSDFFDGKIDEFRVWTETRSVEEIRQNMYRELPNPSSEDNLVAYYQFNETSGTALTDSKGSNDGTLTNYGSQTGYWHTSSAMFGPKKCIEMDGSETNGDYVNCEFVVDPSTLFALTLECWVNVDVVAHYNRIICQDYVDDTDKGIGWLALNNDGTAYSYLGGSLQDSEQSVRANEWTHLAMVWDGTHIYYYFNGKLDENSYAISSLSSSDNDLYLGWGGHYNNTHLDGEMDEIRIWNVARDKTQIRENMCKNLTGNEAGLIAYYTFDNTSGGMLQDFAYNDEALNDGTLYNMDNAGWVSSSAFNTWLNTSSSSWSTASNWSNGVPSSTGNVGIYNLDVEPDLSGLLTFNNLYLGAGISTTLLSGMTVNSSLILDTDLDLNGNTVTLGSSGTLIENSGRLYGSTGTITTTHTLGAVTNENVAGLGAEITTSANMGSTTITRSHAVQSGAGNMGIQRYYDIAPETTSGLDATLVFHYDDAELYGKTESDLMLFRSADNGATWASQGGTVDTEANTITLSGIDAFSRWTASDSEHPLPVTLSEFSAHFIQQPKLFWTTQSESDNAGWHVWRSEEDDYASAQQISVDLIAGAGSCTVPTEYQFIDQAAYQAGCQYYYWLESISIAGESELHGPVTLTIPQGSMQSPPTPQEYGLMQNHPNPFNPCTEINFALPQSAHCTIDVYNISGRKVITLIDEVVTANVMHTVIWQGDDAQGNPVASGIYLYKMRAGKYTAIKKMMMMK
jgi:hypothetical protein